MGLQVFVDLRNHVKSAVSHALKHQLIDKQTVRDEINSLFAELVHVVGNDGTQSDSQTHAEPETELIQARLENV